MILALTSDSLRRWPDVRRRAIRSWRRSWRRSRASARSSSAAARKPAVRVELNPHAARTATASASSTVRTALGARQRQPAQGRAVRRRRHAWQLDATDQLFKADEYRPLIVAYQQRRRRAAARRRRRASTRSKTAATPGLANGKPAVLLIIFRQPGANMIETVDRVRALLPQLQASIPPAIKLSRGHRPHHHHPRLASTTSQFTLMLSIVLVILVVFVFLRNGWATFIPSVAVPLSLLGTFGVMYLLGYSLDNLSLMALTISTGFVVDDAIVVIENITRHLETGMTPMQAALRGASEIGFTVLSMSISLVAVFIPILLMGGIVGRLFREFAVTLAVAIAVSLVVSLTTTPMMCARLLRSRARPRARPVLPRRASAPSTGCCGRYDARLRWVLRHPQPTLLVTLCDHRA